MARKRKHHEQKLRTREHIIADLSVNYVERHIFLRGFSVDEFDSDYGIDLVMHTYNDVGEVETAHVLFQIKATDSLRVLKDGQNIAVTVTVADVKRWQLEWFPVILAIYDAQKDKAWWLYVQQYLDERNIALDDLAHDQETVTIRIPVKNRLNKKAVEKFRGFRDAILEQIKGGPKHGG